MISEHEIATVVLDRIRFSAAHMLPGALVESIGVEYAADYASDALLVRLRADVLGEHLPPTAGTIAVSGIYRHRVPAGPWQLFKAMYGERPWMRWRRWHVVYAPAVDVPFTTDVRVDYRQAWKYPRAALTLPSAFGPAVLHVDVDARADAPTLGEIRDRRYQ